MSSYHADQPLMFSSWSPFARSDKCPRTKQQDRKVSTEEPHLRLIFVSRSQSVGVEVPWICSMGQLYSSLIDLSLKAMDLSSSSFFFNYSVLFGGTFMCVPGIVLSTGNVEGYNTVLTIQ